MTALVVIAAALQLQIPDPVGFVNDFANVIDPASERSMQAVIDQVRLNSGGEIVVVTLSDLEGRASIEVARDIIRAWGIGAQGEAGDRARNAGVVILLQPGARPGDGQADLAIGTGTGAEGFVTDARAGRIRDAIGTRAVETGSYAAGLVAGVRLVGEAYAAEFGFALTGAPPTPRPTARPVANRRRGFPIGALVFLVFLFFMLGGLGRRRGMGGILPWLLLSSMGGRRYHGHWRGGWGGGGFGGGGFGGFGGGGFGGFGGGGGGMGGGASGSF